MAIDVKEFYRKFLGINNPYRMQEEMWDLVLENRFPLFLKAPTGSGKTEAVVAPFLSQFVENRFTIAPRLIYVLPMRVLVNSIAERIKKYTQKISPYISVKIQHGDLPNTPFFIADIIVTTLDQFLYGFARASTQVGHHLDIPAGSIASSVVVFDEAHMYRDEFTFSIMRALMEILNKSNIPFVIMTATMPKSLEESLFENIKLSDNQKLIGNIPPSSTLKIGIEEYPLYENNEVNLTEELLEKIKTHKTLIIVNQVKRAQRIYDEIKKRLELEDNQIVLLHSRFTRKDREKYEKKAISLIPHKENGKIIHPENIGIVVSTQVLEAGIDFSAELLLTELAPADSLIQRAGRCARYEGEKGEMIIFPVEEENGYKPYKKEHLSKTFEWLRENKQFNVRNFEEVCSFVDETLDYKANDYEARDTLIDLYECVLYADSKPENIHIRESKPATLVVLDIPIKGKGKIESRIKDVILSEKDKLRNYSMDVDIRNIWKYFKDEIIRWEIQWKYNDKERKMELSIVDLRKNKKPEEKDPRIGPFRTYIIDSNYYKPDMGVYPDESIFI